MAMICGRCKRPAKFERGRGWTHADGGGTYWMRCKKCGWQGSFAKPTVSCPKCGGRLCDDHCVYAIDDGRPEPEPAGVS